MIGGPLTKKEIIEEELPQEEIIEIPVEEVIEEPEEEEVIEEPEGDHTVEEDVDNVLKVLNGLKDDKKALTQRLKDSEKERDEMKKKPIQITRIEGEGRGAGERTAGRREGSV